MEQSPPIRVFERKERPSRVVYVNLRQQARTGRRMEYVETRSFTVHNATVAEIERIIKKAIKEQK